jgi:hypothetical protein
MHLVKRTCVASRREREIGKLSPEQEQLGKEIEANGGRYIVARSIDDVQRAGL